MRITPSLILLFYSNKSSICRTNRTLSFGLYIEFGQRLVPHLANWCALTDSNYSLLLSSTHSYSPYKRAGACQAQGEGVPTRTRRSARVPTNILKIKVFTPSFTYFNVQTLLRYFCLYLYYYTYTSLCMRSDCPCLMHDPAGLATCPLQHTYI